MYQLIHSKLVVLLGISLTGVLLVALVQNYLAKNHNGSLLYWRNSQRLMIILFQTSRNIHIEHAILAIKFFLATDRKLRFIVIVMKYRLLRLKKIFETLDDLADLSLPEAILSLGDACLGPTMSPVLAKILQEEDYCFIDTLIKDGFLKREEIFSFCNLIIAKLSLQAKLNLAYEQSNCLQTKARIREQLAQENIETTGVYFVFVYHAIKKNPRILDIISRHEDNQLSYEILKEIYPKFSLVGELDQLMHDIMEYRYDIQQEASLGKITPNYFLAQLEINRQLDIAKKELQNVPNRPVIYCELPSIIQHNYLELRKKFTKQALQLGMLTGMALILIWEYHYRIGFYCTKPSSWKNRVKLAK